MQDKHVLVLFYDKKDIEQKINVENTETTLGDEIRRGFDGTGVNYTIRTGSPRHEPWLVKAYFNEHRYDGIIVVAGLSCSFDMPGYLMEQLCDNEKLRIKPHDWQNIEIGKGKDARRISIDDTLESKYFQLKRPIPIIGVPTYDGVTHGETAFSSMLMSSRPSDAACVPLQKAYQAALLMTRLLTTPWSDVRITIPDKHVIAYEKDNVTIKTRSQCFQIGFDIASLLDTAFTPYEDAKISFGYETIDDYLRQLRFGEFTPRKPDKKALHVCVYDNLTQLEELSGLADLIIGVYVPPQESRVDLLAFNNIVSRGFESVIHSRVGVGENAAMLVAHALYSVHPTLKPVRFQSLRQRKSLTNVEEFLRIMKEKGKDFEVKE